MGASQGQHTNTCDRGTLKRSQFTTEKSDRGSTKTVYRDIQQKQVTELESREGDFFLPNSRRFDTGTVNRGALQRQVMVDLK